ncbi:MAG: tryptophan 7-halogenase [Frankiaceae bacterium]|nr:tryptophan 7-halogenase [Frankiaceae bacterium]
MALTAYYTGALRYDQPYADDIISEACQDGWIWFIPLDDHTTSVGFVGDEGDLVGAPQDALELQVATSTLTKQLIAPATLARPAKVRKYTNHTVESPLWTNGYLLVGDTAIFVDPLFSTGVHGSLHSSANAAAGIVSVLEGTLAEDRVAAWFDHTFRSHYGRVREMIRLLYGLHPGNSRFWRNRTLSRIGEEDAEDLVRSIGVAGLDFFAMTGDSLALPEPLRRRIGTNSYRPTSAALPMDSVLDLADEAELEPTLMRSGGRLVPSIILRHRRSRTQEYEFAEHGGLHRLLLALDGERDLQSAVAAVNGDATDQDKIALFVGELVSCGLLDPVG